MQPFLLQQHLYPALSPFVDSVNMAVTRLAILRARRTLQGNSYHSFLLPTASSQMDKLIIEMPNAARLVALRGITFSLTLPQHEVNQGRRRCPGHYRRLDMTSFSIDRFFQIPLRAWSEDWATLDGSQSPTKKRRTVTRQHIIQRQSFH